MPATVQPVEVVNQYLDAFYLGDFDTARSLLSDDLSFRGPFIQVDGAEGFVAAAEGLRQIVRGHRTVCQWRDGEEISTLYQMDLETAAGKGSVLMSEWDSVHDGRITSATIVFDSAEFRKLVPQAGTSA